MIRVGRCTYKDGKRIDPRIDGFTPVLVLTASSEYGDLGPYVLKNSNGQIMENIWQAAKVYEDVPASVQHYSRFDKTVIWSHPRAHHVNFHAESALELQEAIAEWNLSPTTTKNKYTSLRDTLHSRDMTLEVDLTDEYWGWREKLMDCPFAVRYPVGFNARHTCLFALKEAGGEHLDYIEARKQIYVPVYTDLVKRTEKFAQLQKRLCQGENLLIIEVDGPHQESLDYYSEKYGTAQDFIVNNTMLVTEDNIHIMLNDAKHPFGHGYCLGMALLNKETQWC